MTLDAPAPAGVTEVRDHQLDRAERTVRLRHRPVHTGVAEADDVSPAIPRRVRQEPRMTIDPPALLGPEVRDDELHRAE